MSFSNLRGIDSAHLGTAAGEGVELIGKGVSQCHVSMATWCLCIDGYFGLTLVFQICVLIFAKTL